MLATFSNTAGSAALLGNQVYSPYGTSRYQKGSMGTAKGFTGQYKDSVSGLDYYNARYYDPVASVFLSADVAQGNISGRNPYDYVGGNPETWSDPSGQRVACPDPNGCNGGVGGAGGGGAGSGNPYWPPPGGVPSGPPVASDPSAGPGACPTLGCKLGAHIDRGSVVVKVGGPSPLSGGSSCGSSAIGGGVIGGGMAVFSCHPNYPSGGSSDGGFVRVDLSPDLATICWVPFGCNEGDTPSESGKDKPTGEVFFADEGNGAKTAQLREELGMPARSLNPDDGQTLAILQTDGKEFWGINGRKSISIEVNAISKDHAEIDALNQLYIDRQASGITGGQGVMWVDRPPCAACGINGGIRSAVQATVLDALEVIYGPGLDKAGGLIPGGIMLIEP